MSSRQPAPPLEPGDRDEDGTDTSVRVRVRDCTEVEISVDVDNSHILPSIVQGIVAVLGRKAFPPDEH